MDRIKEMAAHFDHHDKALAADPQPIYNELREKCPIFHSEMHGGFWVVSNYNDAFQVLQDPETYSSADGPGIPMFIHSLPQIPIEIDPPFHKKYRSIANPAFTLAAVARYEHNFRAIATKLIDGFIDKGRCDLAEDFAKPLPISALCPIFGIPLEDADKFFEWVDTLFHKTANDPEAGLQASTQVYNYFRDVIKARGQKEPEDDLMGVLLAAKIDDQPLTEEELLGFCMAFLNGGIDTTYSSLGICLLYLGQNKEVRSRLIENPALIPSAIDELLRYHSPAPVVARTVTRDVELLGHKLRKGDRVLLLLAAANHDEQEFPNAEEIIIDRTPNKHLSFGTGIHRCIGLHFARVEIKVALEEILRRIPDYAIAEGAKIEWHTGHLRGISSLPVVW